LRSFSGRYASQASIVSKNSSKFTVASVNAKSLAGTEAVAPKAKGKGKAKALAVKKLRTSAATRIHEKLADGRVIETLTLGEDGD
jgi:hypothetical protein